MVDFAEKWDGSQCGFSFIRGLVRILWGVEDKQGFFVGNNLGKIRRLHVQCVVKPKKLIRTA